MRLRPGILFAALCLAPAAHAEDWLAGEYEVVVPDRPTPKRFVLVVTRDAPGQYRDAVFEEVVDGSTGHVERRPVPRGHGASADGVRMLTADEIAKEPGLATANVRCAVLEGMLLCHIPDGASVPFGDRTLHVGYFAGGMHVGLMEVHKRTPGADVPAAPPDPPASR